MCHHKNKIIKKRTKQTLEHNIFEKNCKQMDIFNSRVSLNLKVYLTEFQYLSTL